MPTDDGVGDGDGDGDEDEDKCVSRVCSFLSKETLGQLCNWVSGDRVGKLSGVFFTSRFSEINFNSLQAHWVNFKSQQAYAMLEHDG